MPQTKYVLPSKTIHVNDYGQLHHDQDVPAEVITRAREWEPDTAYEEGDTILTPLVSANDHVMEFVIDTPGTSGNVQPDWEVPGTTNLIEDGTCLWAFSRVPTHTYLKNGKIHRDSGPAIVYQLPDPLSQSISNVLLNTYATNGVITNGTSPSVWAYDLVTRQELPLYFQYTDEFGNRVDNTSGAIAFNRVIGSLYTDGLTVPSIPVHPPADPLENLVVTFRASTFDPAFILTVAAEPASDGQQIETISNQTDYVGPGALDAVSLTARAIYNVDTVNTATFPRDGSEDPHYETFSNLTASAIGTLFLVVRLPGVLSDIGKFDVYHGTGGDNPRLGTYLRLNEFEGSVYLRISSFIEEDAKGVDITCTVLADPGELLVIGLSPNLASPIDSTFTINGVRPGDTSTGSSIDSTDPIPSLAAKVGIRPENSQVQFMEMVLLEDVLGEEDHGNCSSYFSTKWNP